MPERSAIVRLLTIATAAALTGCLSEQTTATNAALCEANAGHRTRVEITARGTVTRVLGVREGPSGFHEGFLVRVPDCGIVIRVEHNVDLGGSIPLRAGEPIELRGEYLYDPRGGIVHYTHHDPSGRHPGGYVLAGGETYR